MTKEEIKLMIETLEGLNRDLDMECLSLSDDQESLLESLKEKLTTHSVDDSSNKGIEEIHKLIVKYSEAEKDIIKRREAVNDVWEITVIDLQLKTNKQFVNDLMLAAGALL